MIVYKPWSADGYQWVIPSDRFGYRTISNVFRAEPGSRVGARWIPRAVRLLTEDDGKQLHQADMPWYSSEALVVTDHARSVLEGVVGEDAEFLPLECYSDRLWLLYPWHLVDAFDEERSEVKRFTSGRIMEVTRYAFFEKAVEGLTCFKVPELATRIFVRESLVTAVQNAGLTGVEFRRVWQSSNL